MKQGEAIRAYRSANDLKKQKFSDGNLARKFFLLVRALQPAYDFQVEEEQKVFAAHPNYDFEAGGIPVPEDIEGKHRAAEEIRIMNEELRAISNLDYDVEFEKFDLDLSEMPKTFQISGEDIENLEPFINFI